jgi:hypothetical protein
VLALEVGKLKVEIGVQKEVVVANIAVEDPL